MIPNAESADAPLYFEYEGNLVTTDGTGEIVGFVGPDGSWELFNFQDEISTQGVQVNKWVPCTEEDLVWMLEKRSGHVAKLKRLQIQEREILERIQKSKLSAMKEIERFDNRFKLDIFALARKFFPKGKKTYSSPFGSVSVTSFSPSLEKDDEKLVLKWALKNCPEAYSQDPPPPPQFLISKVPPLLKTTLIGNPELAAKYGFKIKPGGEREKIDQ